MQRNRNWTIGMLWCCLLAAPAGAQPDLLWGQQFGTSGDDFARALAPDGVDGVFVAGSTQGSLGGPNAGGIDGWLARYNSAGNTLWTAQFGTPVADVPYALGPDGTGGAFVAGHTFGSLGGFNAGSSDAFVARYSELGGLVWVAQLGSSNQDFAYALAPDGNGGVFIAGNTKGNLAGQSAGGVDAWIARYDGNGDLQWARQFGSTVDEFCFAVCATSSGTALIAGSTGGSLNDPNSGGLDAWIAEYSSSGDQIWIVQIGSPADDEVVSLANDGSGGFFVVGNTFGSLGGPSAGDRDGWLARYDDGRNRYWITQFGTDAFDYAQSVARDDAEGVLIAGYTLGSLGGPNAGMRDGFVARRDAAGSLDWVEQLGTSLDDRGRGATPDGSGGAFLTGYTEGDLYGPRAGKSDSFIARFGVRCYPDFVGDGTLDLFDFLGYVNAFNADNPRADCEQNGGLDLFDFLCFLNAFNEGC